MATSGSGVYGVLIPFTVQRGRMRVADGSEKLSSDILLAVSEGDSGNPFLDVGTTSPLWTLNDAPARSLMRHQIAKRFARFEADGRAKLVSIDFPPTSYKGMIEVLIHYLDLELGQDDVIRVNVRSV